jgi:hypothetical protein
MKTVTNKILLTTTIHKQTGIQSLQANLLIGIQSQVNHGYLRADWNPIAAVLVFTYYRIPLHWVIEAFEGLPTLPGNESTSNDGPDEIS